MTKLINIAIYFYRHVLVYLLMVSLSMSFFAGYIGSIVNKYIALYMVIVNIVGGYFLYLWFDISISQVASIIEHDVSQHVWLPTYLLNLFLFAAGYAFGKKEALYKENLLDYAKYLFVLVAFLIIAFYVFALKFDYYDFIEIIRDLLVAMESATPEQNAEFMKRLESQ